MSNCSVSVVMLLKNSVSRRKKPHRSPTFCCWPIFTESNHTDAKRRDESLRIYTHGEKELESYQKKLRDGIDVNINTVAEMKNMCEYLGMDSVQYLGEVDTDNAKSGTYDKIYQ